MGKIEDRMQLALDAANKLHPSAHDAKMQIKRKQHNAVSAAQRLSEVDESHLVIPPTYRNLYERLKQHDPAKAQAFWDKWAYDPRSKPSDPFEFEKKVLAKLGQEAKPLKRRI